MTPCGALGVNYFDNSETFSLVDSEIKTKKIISKNRTIYTILPHNFRIFAFYDFFIQGKYIARNKDHANQRGKSLINVYYKSHCQLNQGH